jgi:hypothetical protein
MANTYTLIDKTTLGSSQASITFSSIPSTYTDLVLKLSARNTSASGLIYFSFNNNASNRSAILLYGAGSGVGSVIYDNTDPRAMIMNESGYTANTFASGEIYIPNYAGSSYKSFSSDSVQENNSTTAFSYLLGGLWSNTAAITSVKLEPYTGSFDTNTSAYLYGISNS